MFRYSSKAQINGMSLKRQYKFPVPNFIKIKGRIQPLKDAAD
jgi:hypothetical protein